MIDYKLIGMRLKNQRKLCAFTQETVAEKAEITTVYLSKIENGHVKPTLDMLGKLCQLLKLDLSELFCEVSPSSQGYQNEHIVRLFQSCSPEVKPVALNLMEQLAKLKLINSGASGR